MEMVSQFYELVSSSIHDHQFLLIKWVRNRKWCHLSNVNTINQIWIEKRICKGLKMLRMNYASILDQPSSSIDDDRDNIYGT